MIERQMVCLTISESGHIRRIVPLFGGKRVDHFSPSIVVDWLRIIERYNKPVNKEKWRAIHPSRTTILQNTSTKLFR